MSAPAIYRVVDISYRNPTLVASAFVGSRYRSQRSLLGSGDELIGGVCISPALDDELVDGGCGDGLSVV